MSIRLEMLQVARLAPTLLGDSSALIESFVRGQQAADGGFCDRDGKSDLYYTSFAIDALTALQAELPVQTLHPYLKSFGEGEGLDFVHLCCLARAWSALEKNPPIIEGVLSRIEAFRAEDGGFNQVEGAEYGSAYGAFLAYGAYADHARPMPEQTALRASLDALKSEQGSWANDREFPIPNVPATAAAVTLYRNLRAPVPEATGLWLLSCVHPEGGFVPFPGAEIPDLLSTAVALHALDGLQHSYETVRETCLDFIDTLWTAEGGFFGTWDDDALDIEYTYYGLLALGHLSFS